METKEIKEIRNLWYQSLKKVQEFHEKGKFEEKYKEFLRAIKNFASRFDDYYFLSSYPDVAGEMTNIYFKKNNKYFHLRYNYNFWETSIDMITKRKFEKYRPLRYILSESRKKVGILRQLIQLIEFYGEKEMSYRLYVAYKEILRRLSEKKIIFVEFLNILNGEKLIIKNMELIGKGFSETFRVKKTGEDKGRWLPDDSPFGTGGYYTDATWYKISLKSFDYILRTYFSEYIFFLQFLKKLKKRGKEMFE